jgi:hypothetical protein
MSESRNHRWPADKLIAEMRRRIEMLDAELSARLCDSRSEVNAILAEHAHRHERVVAEVLAHAGWDEDEYWAALAEHLEQGGILRPRE